jgi:hypothetical protein
VAAFLAAVGPVYARLANDAGAMAVIKKIRTFSEAFAPKPMAVCGPERGASH